MIIPAYPKFANISMRMKREFYEKAAKSPLIVSDYSFPNLIGWNHVRHYQLSRLYGNIIIKGVFGGKNACLPPIGSFRINQTLDVLLNDVGSFVCVPERFIPFFKKAGAKIIPDRDNSDYIFFSDDIINLNGKKFANRRHLLNRFKKTYTFQLKKLTPGKIKYVKKFNDCWYEKNKARLPYKTLDDEYLAAETIFKNFAKLPLCGGMLYVRGEISGYIIGEKLNNQTILLHFEKCDNTFKGAFPALLISFFKEHHFKYANIMQDLGIPNLRKAKLLYRPNHLLKKYRIEKKN